jgi:hypothetical protein
MSSGLQTRNPIRANPWERQRGESAKAFAAWVLYRDMDESRSYQRVAQELSKSETLIKRWGTKWRWQERLNDFLASQDTARLEVHRKAIEEMNSRHISTAMLFQEKTIEKLQSVDINELAPRDLPRWFEVAVAVERSAHGLSPSTKLNAVEQMEFVRPEGNIVDDRIKALSGVDRALLRDLCLKYMQIIKLQATIAADQQSTLPIVAPNPLPPSISAEPAPTRVAEAGPKAPQQHPNRALGPSRF